MSTTNRPAAAIAKSWDEELHGLPRACAHGVPFGEDECERCGESEDLDASDVESAEERYADALICDGDFGGES